MSQDNSTVTSCKKRIGMRFFTHLVAFCFLFQTMLPAYAAALSSGQIQQVLDSIAEIEFSTTSGSYQYTAAPYIDTSVQDGYSNIQDIYKRLRDEHIESLGSPTYVPIGVGDITTILPIYDNPKLVGDSFVQSRYVRDQIQELLGRHLIDSDSAYFKDETSQLKTLYDNAFLYAKLASTTEIYGDPISESKFDRENSPYDMVWPERRVIHGETVIVPVVYLTEQTIAERRVTDHSVGFNSNVSFSRINIQDVDIKLGREAFLNVAGDFVAQNSSVSGCELNIVVGGSLRLLSSQVDACGNLTIDAGSLEARTLVHRYDFGNETGGFFGEVTTISADGHLVVRSGSDIVLQGVTVSAGDELTFAANGNIYIGTENITSSFEGKQGGWYVQRSGVSYLQSKLTAGETIRLIAGGQIYLDAAEIVSDRGHIELLAALGITIEDELESTQSYKKGKFGKTKIEESVYQTVAIRSLLDAGKNIRLHTEFGDITLKAVDITSIAGTTVNASNGKVNLLTTTETDHYTYSSVKKGLFTVTTKNKGHVIEESVQNTIVGGFAVQALQGLTIEYEGNPDLSLDEQIAELSNFEGMEWMADVRQNFPDADWQAIDLAYEQWDESNTSLNAAAMAIITIVVAVVTSGAGAAIIGTTGATASGAAMNAAFTTMINTATIASANATVNGGSFEEVYKAGFEAVLSKDGIKSIAVAAATAGALNKVDAALFGGDTNAYMEAEAVKSAALSEGLSEAVANDLAANAFDLAQEASKMSYTAQAFQAVTHATVSTGIQGLAYGYDSDELTDLFMAALAQNTINTIGRNLSTKIGEAAKAEPAEITTAGQYIAHAAVGCFTGELTASLTEVDDGNACVSGAGGAVIGELIGQAYREELENDIAAWAEKTLGSYDSYTFQEFDAAIKDFLQRGVDMGRLAAAFTAFAVNADVDIAARSAETAAKYNATFGVNPYGSFNTVHRTNQMAVSPSLLLADEIYSSAMNKILRIGNGETLDLFSDTFWRDEATKYGGLYNTLAAISEQVIMDPEFNVEAYLAVLLIEIPVSYTSFTLGGDQDSEQLQLSELPEADQIYLEDAAELQIRNGIRELLENEELRQQEINNDNRPSHVQYYEELIGRNIKVIRDGVMAHPSMRVVEEQTKLTPGGIPIVENGPTTLAHPVPEMDQIISLIREILDDEGIHGTLDNPAYDGVLPTQTETLIPDQNPLDTVMYSTSDPEKVAFPESGAIPFDIALDSNGGKGGRRNPLNVPAPNKTIFVDNQYIYMTDAFGRTFRIVAEDLNYTLAERSQHQQDIARERGNPGVEVDGGHGIGAQFNGSGALINMFPQLRYQNRSGGAWFAMETQWAAAKQQNLQVSVDMRFNYTASSLHPDSIYVTYTIEGQPTQHLIFEN
ncbi:DNA/RNA non-specific endonuclease [Microbulbifer sp. MKSA007]|nr:DNA/RNA non-specific endonuclease [Microbulbifer sp. MKSA007]